MDINLVGKNNTLNQKKFNKDFEFNDMLLNKTKLSNSNLNIDNEILVLPHQQTVENIIISIRDLFYIILDMLENKQNPIPFILASDSRIFSFSLFLIISGSLLLLLSSLMKSPNESFN